MADWAGASGAWTSKLSRDWGPATAAYCSVARKLAPFCTDFVTATPALWWHVCTASRV